jgi:Prokaryotic dksA/traR C4-type zinc finger
MSWTESSTPASAISQSAISNAIPAVSAKCVLHFGVLIADTFGSCIDSCIECEVTINPKRLAAIPSASSCIVCQKAADREQKAHGTDIDTALVMAA